MKKTIFAFLVALLLPLIAPLSAHAALLGPAQKLEQGLLLRGRFTEDHPVKGFTQPMHSEGRFLVAPGQGVIWWIEKPMAMTVVITPQGMTQLIGGVPILRFSGQSNAFLGKATFFLEAALGGHLNALEKDFAVMQSGTPRAWKTILTPRDPSAPFQRLVAEGGATVTSAQAISKSGKEDTFTFSNQTITRENLAPAEEALFETFAPEAKTGHN